MTSAAIRVHSARDGQRDFEFLLGNWTTKNRRRSLAVDGTSEWIEFESRSVVRALWGGAAVLEEYRAVAPEGPLDGLSLNLYDPAARQWSQTWATRSRGSPDQPTFGGFREGRGEFHSHEPVQGRRCCLRIVWSDITPASCRWEQSISDDGGRTWETNWVMEFTRV